MKGSESQTVALPRGANRSVQFNVVLLVVAVPDVPIMHEFATGDELVVDVQVRMGVLLEQKGRPVPSNLNARHASVGVNESTRGIRHGSRESGHEEGLEKAVHKISVRHEDDRLFAVRDCHVDKALCECGGTLKASLA